MKKTVKQITPHFEWLKYFSDNNGWNNKALEFIKKEEEVAFAAVLATVLTVL